MAVLCRQWKAQSEEEKRYQEAEKRRFSTCCSSQTGLLKMMLCKELIRNIHLSVSSCHISRLGSWYLSILLNSTLNSCISAGLNWNVFQMINCVSVTASFHQPHAKTRRSIPFWKQQRHLQPPITGFCPHCWIWGNESREYFVLKSFWNHETSSGFLHGHLWKAVYVQSHHFVSSFMQIYDSMRVVAYQNYLLTTRKKTRCFCLALCCHTTEHQLVSLCIYLGLQLKFDTIKKKNVKTQKPSFYSWNLSQNSYSAGMILVWIWGRDAGCQGPQFHQLNDVLFHLPSFTWLMGRH